MAPRGDSSYPCSPKGVSFETLELQVQEFMTSWEMRIMESPLAKTMKHHEAVASALELLAMNGVDIDAADIGIMSHMDDRVLVGQIADRIPPQLRDNFEILASQLQIMLNTVSSVRGTLDSSPDNLNAEIEGKMETDRTLQQVLKLAVLQASKEAAHLQKCSTTWGGKMEKRLEALSKASQFAEEAAHKLVTLEMQLSEFMNDSKAKGKKALMGMAEGSDKARLKSVWAAWSGETMANKETREMRAKYEQELVKAEDELFKYKEKQLSGVRQMLMSRVRESDRGLVDLCISSWYDVVQQSKKDGDVKAELEKLQEKMAGFRAEAKNKQMAVFGRLAGDREQAVVVLAMTSWINFHADYAKNKEYEDEVRKAEVALNEHLKGKKEETKKLLERMSASTDTGLLGNCWRTWLQTMEEEKKAKKLADEMAKTDVRLKQMLDNRKGNAFGVSTRINEQINENLLLKVLSAWILEFKVAHVEKYYDKKISGKRQQLSKVHTLFKSFAQQLEDNLNPNDDETERTTRRPKAGLTKGDGAVSLPDIHARAPIA